MAAFALKTTVDGPCPDTLARSGCKSMYAGRTVAAGDTVFVFADEAHGGRGLLARCVAIEVRAVPPYPGLTRQTPRVDLVLRCQTPARRPLGRAELKPYTAWDDDAPETELNFKLFRQATPKIVGLSEAASAYLDAFF